MPLTEHDTLDGVTTKEAWDLYWEVFEPVNGMAAQRHLMTLDEFVAVCEDPRVRKYLVRDDTGRLVGISTLTNYLDAWPLISPAYFARRWPEHYRCGRIWYVGFVGARANDAHAFRELLVAMWKQQRVNDGISFMDYCSFNVDEKRIPQITRALMARAGFPVETQQVDAQTFWILTAPGDAAAAAA